MARHGHARTLPERSTLCMTRRFALLIATTAATALATGCFLIPPPPFVIECGDDLQLAGGSAETTLSVTALSPAAVIWTLRVEDGAIADFLTESGATFDFTPEIVPVDGTARITLRVRAAGTVVVTASQVWAPFADPVDQTCVIKVTAEPGVSQAVTIADTDFDPADWSETVTQTGVSNHTVVQQTIGGNDGAFRRMTHEVAGTGSLSVVHVYQAEQYDPATQGAFSRITYSEDRAVFDVNAAIQAAFVLVQGGHVFTASLLDVEINDTDWRTLTVVLETTDFGSATTSGSPDFSANGAAINFGYQRSNSTDTTVETGHGIDNWKVTIE